MGSDSTAQKSSIPLTVGVKTRRTGRGGESYKKKVVEGSQKKREGEEFETVGLDGKRLVL